MNGGPVAVLVDRQRDATLDADRWKRLATDVLVAEGVTAGELSLLFVERDEMRRLNSAHMAKDSPTDVLAFPLDGADSRDEASLIGDVVVCPAVAAANAGTALDDEIALLVVHGVLHCLGHDHADDAEAQAMQARERRLLAECYHR